MTELDFQSARTAVLDGARLHAVQRTELLDSPAEEVFDRLTRLAVNLLGVPAAFVSLVDENRDFYKSACGFGEPLASARELRGETFCHYTVAKAAPLIIPDTAAHPVYRNVPTVKSLGVAAYVGIPLIVDHQPIGAFCAIDFAPRQWSEREVEVLTELAAAARREIELRLAVRRQQKLASALEERISLADAMRAAAEEARAAAMRSEARFRAVEDASPDGSILLRPIRDAGTGAIADFEYVYVNPAAPRILGTEAAGLLGKRLMQTYTTSGTAGRLEGYARAFESGLPWTRRVVIPAAARELNLLVTAVRADELLHVRFTNIDAQVAERAASAAQYAEAKIAEAAATAANRAKAQFVAGMSHELRTPLNAIGGFTQLIELGVHGPVTEAQREALGRVQGAQTRLLRLINDVLDHAKIDAGHVRYDIAPVDVGAIVREVVPLVAADAAAKTIAIAVDVPADSIALADAGKLQQILINLLSNAIKFTDGGTGDRDRTVSIDIGAPDATDADRLLYLRVTDNGRGIDRRKHDAVFEPFVQILESDATHNHGTGLGLAISRDLARGMGGDLRVRSALGEGATFTISLRRPF